MRLVWTLALVVGLTVVLAILGRTAPALAHCDSINGPVVGAARAALEANRERVEAELLFEIYVSDLYKAATGPAAHGECAAPAAAGHTH